MTALTLDQIRTDPGTQARANMDMDTVIEYADVLNAYKDTWPFPRIVIYHDNAAYWLADGYHRVAAARRLSYPHAIPADVRRGSRRDAILYAVGANADHGLKRSPADKRSAVLILLRDAEWGRWSDREIARACRVSHTFVADMRRGMVGDAPPAVSGNVATDEPERRTYTTKHGTEATIIYYPVRALQTAVADWLRQQDESLARQFSIALSLKLHGKNYEPWGDMIAALPTPHRSNDVSQAVNNVADIWRQMVEERAQPVGTPTAPRQRKSPYEWLRDYQDDDGRTWRDLSDNQVHHANSPCYQAFVKAFPAIRDSKLHLKVSLAQLRRETAVPGMPPFDEIKAAIIKFVESQETWPELAGHTFTAPLHHLRAETPTFFDQYATAIRDKYFDGFPIPDEVIQQAAAHIWGERSQAASRAMMAEAEAARAKEATPDTAVAATKLPRRCPRCQAENRAETVAADHWRCRNCGREYDHTGKIPANIPDPADDEPGPSRMAQSRLSIHASALGLSMDAYNEAVEGNVSLYTINSDNWDIVVLPHRPKAEHGLDILQLIINQLDRLIATTQPPEMHIYNRARINVDNALLELKNRNKG